MQFFKEAEKTICDLDTNIDVHDFLIDLGNETNLKGMCTVCLIQAHKIEDLELNQKDEFMELDVSLFVSL